ncbi:MAG: hypothetical protein O2821_11740 [Chloroflexi bacterium]|nr:hypothetical protein [Chloroflexota bacterium]MDA1228678.1 hypothetical protein [Chloroflexota bacterium]
MNTGRLWLLTMAVTVGGLALACSTSVATQEKNANEEIAEARFDEVPLIKGPVSPDGLQVIFGTPDLGLGKQRVGVVLTSPLGLVRSPLATFTTYFAGESVEPEGQHESSVAFFNPFPLNTRGIYTANMDFDRPGKWRLEVSVIDDNAQNLSAEIEFLVKETTSAPSAGMKAIASNSKTINDVDDLAEITTGSLHDPDLYQISIADAVVSGRPTVIVMASPAFCTNAVCGPQVEVLQEIKDAYKGQANFIHIDIYDNPEEIQGDLSRAMVSPTVREWNLPSTEWSFVIDSSGLVHQRFESFAGYKELEASLKEVL